MNYSVFSERGNFYLILSHKLHPTYFLNKIYFVQYIYFIEHLLWAMQYTRHQYENETIYCWHLNNIGLNCTGPFIHGFFFCNPWFHIHRFNKLWIENSIFTFPPAVSQPQIENTVFHLICRCQGLTIESKVILEF